MDFYINVDEEQIEKIKKFNPSLGYNALAIATMLAPYDTGNLRRSIKLTRNTSKEIKITYNTLQANYIKFLEEGIGSVKKHKGFIGEATVSALVESMLLFCQNGHMIVGQMPINTLRTSTSVFGKEKQILKQMNMKTSSLNADVRQKISMIREAEYRQINGEPIKAVRGISLSSKKIKKYKRQNVSQLQKQYTLIKNNKLL